MESLYQQSPHTRVRMVGDTMVLFRDDRAAAFSINETGQVLWQALPRFPTVEGLAALMAEARPDDDPTLHKQEVSLFLDELVRLGLVRLSGPVRLRRAGDLTSETVGDELLLFKGDRKHVHAINETGAVLWAALDHYPRQDQLVELLIQAWPDRDSAELERLVADFVAELIDLGFLEYETEATPAR